MHVFAGLAPEIRITKPTNHTSPHVGSNLTINGIITSSCDPAFTSDGSPSWRKDNKELPGNHSVELDCIKTANETSCTSSVSMLYSSDNDAGSYTLSARNKCGFSSGYVDIGTKGTAI